MTFEIRNGNILIPIKSVHITLTPEDGYYFIHKVSIEADLPRNTLALAERSALELFAGKIYEYKTDWESELSTDIEREIGLIDYDYDIEDG